MFKFDVPKFHHYCPVPLTSKPNNNNNNNRSDRDSTGYIHCRNFLQDVILQKSSRITNKRISHEPKRHLATKHEHYNNMITQPHHIKGI